MRLAFLGLPLAGVLLARDGHELVYAGVLPEKGLRRLEKLLPPGRRADRDARSHERRDVPPHP